MRQPAGVVKLALVTETFPPEVNGVAMTFGVITRELALRGHEVTVYHPQRPDLAPGRATTGVRQVALPGFAVPRYPQVRLGWPAQDRFVRAWREHRPDVVHVATEGPLGYSAVRAARRLRLPITSSFHTNFHHYTRAYGLPLLRSTMLSWLRHVHNQTLRTLAPTPELAAELTALGFRRTGVLARGVDTRLFHPARRSVEQRAAWGADDATPVVLHVGRMAPEKNYRLLFEIYHAMQAANPQLRFVLAGEGPLRAQLQREHPQCWFEGFYSRAEIGRIFASADIYIHTSLTETFGNVLTEAMASGLAVAGFHYAAARQLIVSGEHGLTAPCDQPAALTHAAIRLAREPDLRRRLRPKARAAAETLSWSRVIADFEHELAGAIPGVGRAPVAA